jgi:hypothetical protein
MEIIYKCQYTGKEFVTQEDCEVHEYIHGGEQQRFYDLVNEFIVTLERKYPNIQILKPTIKMSDHKEFLYRDRIERNRSVRFDFTLDGKHEKYRRYSDEVGDWRWDWKIKDDVDDFILDFEKEFIYPKMKVLEGIIEQEWHHSKGLITTFGELDGNYFLRLLSNKKIRIEILEDYNEDDE